MEGGVGGDTKRAKEFSAFLISLCISPKASFLVFFLSLLVCPSAAGTRCYQKTSVGKAARVRGSPLK